jgi:hypothetical protein
LKDLKANENVFLFEFFELFKHGWK